jgi:hypothetical protein
MKDLMGKYILGHRGSSVDLLPMVKDLKEDILRDVDKEVDTWGKDIPEEDAKYLGSIKEGFVSSFLEWAILDRINHIAQGIIGQTHRALLVEDESDKKGFIVSVNKEISPEETNFIYTKLHGEPIKGAPLKGDLDIVKNALIKQAFSTRKLLGH